MSEFKRPLTRKQISQFNEAVDSSANTETNQIIAMSIRILLGAELWWREAVKKINPYTKMPSGRMECVFCGVGNNGETRPIGEFKHEDACVWLKSQEEM